MYKIYSDFYTTKNKEQFFFTYPFNLGNKIHSDESQIVL